MRTLVLGFDAFDPRLFERLSERTARYPVRPDIFLSSDRPGSSLSGRRRLEIDARALAGGIEPWGGDGE